MVSMSAGMASVGMKPYIAAFAPFVGLLAGEQIRTDLAYPGLPVRILAHHAGIAIGFYGTSHHATEDLGLMRSIANMTVVCPCDATATEAALRQTADLPGPVYFRLGRGRDEDVYDARPGRLALRRGGGAARGRRPDDRRQRGHVAPARWRRPRRSPPTGSRRA